MDKVGAGTPASRALILLDFQHDFLADDGRLPIARHQIGPVLAASRLAVDHAQGRGHLIIKVGNEFKRVDVLGNLFRRWAAVAGSPGAAWDSRINPDDTLFLWKSAGSAFTNPALDSALQARGVRTVSIAGLFAKGCVKATAEAALRRGYAVELLRDAIGCSSDRSRGQALKHLSRQGAILNT